MLSGIAVISDTDPNIPDRDSEPFHPNYFYPFYTDMAPPEGNQKGHRTPEAYDGKVSEDFPQWVTRFEMIAKANNWGEGDALLGIFPIYLKDHAFNLFTTLAAGEKDTYANLIAAMRKALGIGENSLSWRLQLRQAKRSPTESMDSFAFRLAKLVDQAYPGDNAAAQERNVVEQFILGQKPELARYLLQDKMGSLADLKDKAKRFEAAQELAGGGTRGIYHMEAEGTEASTSAINCVNESDQGSERVLRAALNLIASGATNYNWGSAGLGSMHRPGSEPRRCFKCNEPGHIAAQCRTRIQNKSSNLVCFQCNQPGHFKRNCPQVVGSKFTQRQTSSKEVSGVTCFHCNNAGHRAADCRTDITKSCSFCQKKGHLVNDCRLKNNRTKRTEDTTAARLVLSKNDVTEAEMGPTWS